MRGYSAIFMACTAILAVMSAPISSVSAQDYQNYPERPVTVIVPYPPGGSSDNTARPYAQHLSEFFGEQFVIENRGGAGGTIGADVAAQAKPDGYTLFLTPTAVLTIKPNVVETLAYTPLEDRSEEHTSELQSLMRISYAVFCLKKKK